MFPSLMKVLRQIDLDRPSESGEEGLAVASIIVYE